MNLDKLESAERKALKQTKTVIKDKKALMDWLFSGPSTTASPVVRTEVKTRERKTTLKSEEYLVKGNEKKCNCCFETKDISQFYKHTYNVDGYNGQCKSCVDGKRMDLYRSKEDTYQFHVKNETLFTCKCCKKEKLYTEFEKNLSFSEAFRKTCRECERS